MKIITLAFPVFTMCIVSPVLGVDDDFNIDVKQRNAEVYHEQSSKKNEFNYGYQVEKENSQFQHKVKGPDDVTYGCYGYIDPTNEKHLYYYVADRLGYRLVPPNQPTKIFTERVTSSVNKLNDALKDKKLDEKVVSWNDLYLPDSCRRLNEILTISTPAPQPIQTDSNGNNGRVIGVSVTTKAPAVITTPAPPPTTKFIQIPSTTSKPPPSKQTVNVDSSSDQHIAQTNPAPKTTTPSPVAQNSFNPVWVAPSSNAPAPTTVGYKYPAPKNPLPYCQPESNPTIGPYNGYVYPIHAECSSTEYSIHQLLDQMEALNQQVLHLTANMRALQQSNSTSPDCQQWLARQQYPLLVYVPIILPQHHGAGSEDSGPQQSFKNPASYAFQKMCEECISK
ncbi:probable inactive serine/threonine-protein kinase DDB_G0280131 [Armigeres subalbatus]|uniref:probable inactive serine/threonine-protein kinase DDB_G0280131 n=1 Tax=Armigeres subalbatus TaxID=124917 RepID=UPI002ED4248E